MKIGELDAMTIYIGLAGKEGEMDTRGRREVEGGGKIHL
jgi:hypothetical protein